MIGTNVEQPRGRFALIGGRIILPDRIVVGQAVVVEGGTIVGIADLDSLGADMETIAVEGRYLAPRLIDIHIHGALGHTFNAPTPEAFAAITDQTVTCGVTALLASVATAPHSPAARHC